MEKRVAEHEAAVVKMRRRVKSLVDVTDKYSVPNIFTRCRGQVLVQVLVLVLMLMLVLVLLKVVLEQ